jgi:formylglycine-generating enzyme required for sulfatase activity
MISENSNLWRIHLVLSVIYFVSSVSLTPSQIFAQQDGKGADIRIVSKLPNEDKRWALIIGIDRYEKDASSLKGAVNDAKALKDALVKYAGFFDDHVILLTSDAVDPDNLPRRENILDALNRLISNIPEDGLFLFSFSGHGVSVNDRAYLIPSNGRFTKSLSLLRDYSIDVERIRETVKEIKIKQVLIILDACRNEPGKGETANPLTEVYKRGFSFDVANGEVKAFATLYATSVGERAFEFYDKEMRQYRGYFSYAVEEAIKGKVANKNGEVTLGSLISYVENTVPARVHSEQGEKQEPSKEIAGYKESELVLSVVRAGAGPGSPTVAGVQTGEAPSPSIKTGEASFWGAVQESQDPSDFDRFLAAYPNGTYAALAKFKRDKLRTSAEISRYRNPKQGMVMRREIANGVEMEFVGIPTGEFLMGRLPDDNDRKYNELPQRKVVIKDGFWMGKYEVTERQWKAVMKSSPSSFETCDDCPVNSAKWLEVQQFIQRLNERNDGFEYRLPSEAEWEYAARANTKTRFYWGDDWDYSMICGHANVADLETQKTQPFKMIILGEAVNCNDGYAGLAPVGKFQPNGFDLYDMIGNAQEWCQDIFSRDYKHLPNDGSANLSIGDPNERVVRGGSYVSGPERGRDLGSASRSYDSINYSFGSGFRLVAVPRGSNP